MGRKGNWFGAMKKALSSESKDQKTNQGSSKSKKKWFGRRKSTDTIASISEVSVETTATTSSAPAVAPPLQPVVPAVVPPEAAKLEDKHREQQQASSIAVATARASEAANAAAQAAAEVVRLTNAARFSGKSKEEAAAIRIQTALRGHAARRVVRAMRGRARLKILLQGMSVKRQTANTLKSFRTMARMQSQIHATRMRMSEENRTRQRQLLEKHARELDKIQNLHQNVDDWNTSSKSKEHIAARLQSKQEAAIKRERALAYSFNHQRTWRNTPTTKPAQTLFMDNPHWGWSWLEGWLAARPWEAATTYNPDLAPLPPTTQAAPGAQIAKALLYHVNEKPSSNASSPRSLNSQSSPRATQKQRNSTGRLSASNTRSASPRARTRSNTSTPRANHRRACEEDTRSMQSERTMKQSVAGSSVAGEETESLTSSLATDVSPSYMAPTKSARAKSRSGSPARMDRVSVSSAKRRVSLPPSPARSRRSTSSNTDAVSIGDGK